jgi:hypothetical protein
MAQAIECLLSKSKVLSSNSVLLKYKKSKMLWMNYIFTKSWFCSYTLQRKEATVFIPREKATWFIQCFHKQDSLLSCAVWPSFHSKRNPGLNLDPKEERQTPSACVWETAWLTVVIFFLGRPWLLLQSPHLRFFTLSLLTRPRLHAN